MIGDEYLGWGRRIGSLGGGRNGCGKIDKLNITIIDRSELSVAVGKEDLVFHVLASMTSSYELLTTTRYDELLKGFRWNNDRDGESPFLLLPYHYDRLRDAAARHGWQTARTSLSYPSLKSACLTAIYQLRDSPEAQHSAFRLRITLTESAVLNVQASLLDPFVTDPTSASFFKPLSDTFSSVTYGPKWTLYIDPESTPSSLFTQTKTTQRDMYDNARSRVGLTTSSSSPSDVILHNERDLVTESSICNIAFYRSGRWITPPASTGCMPGVLRRWLLREDRIREADERQFTRDTLKNGDWVMVFNGVQGCRLGTIAVRDA